MSAVEQEKIEMTPDEAAFIAHFTSAYCRPHADVVRARLAQFVAARQLALVARTASADFALAAGPSAPAVEPKAPEEEVRFTFVSDGSPDSPGAWRAELVIPPGAGAETPVALTVTDGPNEPAKTAFTLAGTTLPLVEGRAELPFGIFLAGMKDPTVALRRVSGPVVRGTLAFFI